MAEGGGNGGSSGRSPSPFRESPPKAVIDTSPILIDQNKESLKVKLLLRRPFDQLVAQGIMPPHGQRRSAERAKTGDILKAKIQQRPPRQELERRHILEADTLHADPSLAERQRMLKKARLADQLNDQLSHRPGPLELIHKNILHTEEPIEQAVKTGKIAYKATSEGALKRPQHPHNYVNPEEDSQGSSEGDTRSPEPSDVLETAAKSAGIMVSLVQPNDVVLTATVPGLGKDNGEFIYSDLCRSVTGTLLSQASASSPASLVSSTSTLSPLSSVASPVPSIASQPATPAPIPPPPPPPINKLTHVNLKSDAPGKDKNRKKCKAKTAPKTRTIKFHEYKGPPSAQKSSSNTNGSGESSYDLLLQQQQMLLQCQLQLQHKYPQFLLPAQKPPSETSPASVNSLVSNINVQQHSPATSTTSESSTPSRITGRLEDMKVSDLKAELKRRSLPVSGSKPQLIERLKPFTNQSSDTVSNNPGSVDSSIHSNDHSQDLGSPQDSLKDETHEQMELGDPSSPVLTNGDSDLNPKLNEDLVREQQLEIERLQRQLQLSNMKLQALGGNTRAELQKHLQAKQQQQQAQQQQQPQQQNLTMPVRQLQELQAQQAQINKEQQLLQQQQHIVFQNRKNLNAKDPKPMNIVLSADANFVYQLIQGKSPKFLEQYQRAGLLPNVFTTTIEQPEIKKEPVDNIKINELSTTSKPPPLYEEATKQIKKSSVKCQDVDDVLEILIKNGELPASAASYPSTPGSAGTKLQEPVYPTSQPDQQGNLAVFEDNSLDLPHDLIDTLDWNQLMDLEGDGQQENNNVGNMANPGSIVPMETDEWLDSLIAHDNAYQGTNSCNPTISLHQDSQDLGNVCDPLLGLSQDDTFDPFNLSDYRSPTDLTLSWDRIDYAA